MERPEDDAEHLEGLQIARRALGRTSDRLAAIEAIGAAASALEHDPPMQDLALAQQLRLSVNLLLYLSRHQRELISEINELDGTYARADAEAAAYIAAPQDTREAPASTEPEDGPSVDDTCDDCGQRHAAGEECE
jgi:hypothetical protein